MLSSFFIYTFLGLENFYTYFLDDLDFVFRLSHWREIFILGVLAKVLWFLMKTRPYPKTFEGLCVRSVDFRRQSESAFCQAARHCQYFSHREIVSSFTRTFFLFQVVIVYIFSSPLLPVKPCSNPPLHCCM